MAENKARSPQAAQQTSLARMYSPDLQPLIQSLLATLADFDLEYEHERDKINTRMTDINLKIRMLEKLKQNHRQRREPYLQQLAILQERIRQSCIEQ